ncbi:hypothetical protein [Pseudoduganella buxea]|uniref:DUF3304 domain-containing protein n=1 Tax=Pseudoduganella buxea TaxID=1949069 RepID=A0A6I3SYQ4_9BURK|nr:hypothetical protein [Pseudoduganella buxea]MTV53775.1 hypothetical protein [Pseudoduganella buxea]GGC01898.1 hypothetical protein GCM10011572_24740 [Pseudoduganella buxea]
MKKKLPLLLAVPLLALQSCSRPADPAFYVVDVADGGHAHLYTTQANIDHDQARKLPVAFFDRKGPDCCFVFGDKLPRPVTDMQRMLLREQPDGDEEGRRIAGRYAPAGMVRKDDWPGLGFGFDGMGKVRRLDAMTHEVRFADSAPPVFVRHCTTGEGVRIALLRARGDASPYASYYYALGYDTEPDCPDMVEQEAPAR